MLIPNQETPPQSPGADQNALLSLEPRDHHLNLISTHFHMLIVSHIVENKIKYLRVLRIILVVLPEHPSDTKVFTMKMEILLERSSLKLLVGDM